MARFFFITMSFITTLFLYAENTPASYSYTAAVSAISKGEAKTITAKINGKTLKNTLLLTATKQKDGSIKVTSCKFKLGKMPIESAFWFVLPKEKAVKNEAGNYSINGLKGIYKVLFSKTDTLFNGTFNEKSCNFTLNASRKGKTIEMTLSKQP